MLLGIFCDGAVEGLMKIKWGNMVSLSEQQLVGCTKLGNPGCNFNSMEHAFQYIGSVRGSQIHGFERVPANYEKTLLKAVTKQPLSISIEATAPGF